MPTLKQKKAADRYVENHGNASRAMLEAGYSPNAAKNPKTLTESKGFKEVLEEYGLTEGLVTKALVEDIKKKKGRRVQELALGVDILGMKKNPDGGNQTNILIITGESAQRYGSKPGSTPTSRDTEDSST